MAVGRARLGGNRSGRIVMVGLAVVALSSLLVACDSGSNGTTTGTVPVVPLAVAPYTYRPMRVDLQISGSHTLTISGVAGQCRFAEAGLPAAFIVTDPQLGAGGQIVVYGPTSVAGVGNVAPNIKSMINGSGLLSPANGQGVTVAADLESATLNTTMSGPAVGPTGTVTGWATDTITGTLRCV